MRRAEHVQPANLWSLKTLYAPSPQRYQSKVKHQGRGSTTANISDPSGQLLQPSSCTDTQTHGLLALGISSHHRTRGRKIYEVFYLSLTTGLPATFALGGSNFRPISVERWWKDNRSEGPSERKIWLFCAPCAVPQQPRVHLPPLFPSHFGRYGANCRVVGWSFSPMRCRQRDFSSVSC